MAAMVVPAEQRQVRKVGGAAVFPRDDVMHVEKCGGRAAGVGAMAIALLNEPTQLRRDESMSAPDVSGRPVGVVEHYPDGCVATQAGSRGGREDDPVDFGVIDASVQHDFDRYR
jgi:hypothetical protein